MAENIIIQHRALTTAEWQTSTIIPYDRELVLEKCEDGRYKIKVGDGIHTFPDLSYVVLTTD
jgi:hypothetical protein